jgi:hypothetical protein
MIISKALVNRLLGLFHGAAKNGIRGQTLADARVGSCNTTISHPHGMGQELFLGPIRIDLFSPDKQLLYQLVPPDSDHDQPRLVIQWPRLPRFSWRPVGAGHNGSP